MSSVDRKELDAVSNHISNIPSIGAVYAPVLVEHCRALLKEVERLTDEGDAAAQAAKLRAALDLAEVEVYLAKTWCRVCRTEGLGDLRSREAHPHARECLLYRDPEDKS